jgi:hypothetical protein
MEVAVSCGGSSNDYDLNSGYSGWSYAWQDSTPVLPDSNGEVAVTFSFSQYYSFDATQGTNYLYIDDIKIYFARVDS